MDMENKRISRAQRYKEKRHHFKFKLLTGLFCIFWATVLLMFTSATEFDTLFHVGIPIFRWNPIPNFMDLFKFNDFNIIHRNYFIVKLGHFIGFAFLDFMIYLNCGKKRTALIITILFASTTEIFQLFTFRDGRIYDILIDSAGAWLSYKKD
jgi:VanZ family protein